MKLKFESAPYKILPLMTACDEVEYLRTTLTECQPAWRQMLRAGLETREKYALPPVDMES